MSLPFLDISVGQFCLPDDQPEDVARLEQHLLRCHDELAGHAGDVTASATALGQVWRARAGSAAAGELTTIAGQLRRAASVHQSAAEAARAYRRVLEQAATDLDDLRRSHQQAVDDHDAQRKAVLASPGVTPEATDRRLDALATDHAATLRSVYGRRDDVWARVAAAATTLGGRLTDLATTASGQPGKGDPATAYAGTLAANLASVKAITQAEADSEPGAPGGPKFVIGPPTRPPLSFDDDFPYDPDAHPSWHDRLNWAKWKLKLKGGDVVRSDLDDALESYRHYMDGSGKPLDVDYDEAYREDSAIHTAVDNEIASARTDAERLVRESGRTSFSMTGDATSVTKLGAYPTTENWQKTLGDHQIWSSADVHVDGDTVTMTVTVHAEDRYNFNKGAADIATGAPDNENGRFATLGWAKAYDTHGQLTRTVTWHVGDPAHPTADGGSDPQRDPGREDREDGRGSSAGNRPVVPDNNRDTGGPRVG